MKQCRLKAPSPTGHYELMTWLPDEESIEGNTLVLKDYPDTWTVYKVNGKSMRKEEFNKRWKVGGLE